MRLPVGAAAAVLASLLAAAACAPRTATTGSGQDSGHSASVSYGTIVSMRAGVAPGGSDGIGNNDVRASILLAIGSAGVGGPAVDSIGAGQAFEFIIREDTGQTVSVVQSNELNFRPGDRVAIARGTRTRLAHGAPPPPPPGS